MRDYLGNPNLPHVDINEENRAWQFSWGSRRFDKTVDLDGLPTKDHAEHLISGLRFHLTPLFHLFDEQEFTRHLHSFYANSMLETSSNTIWFVQYLVILAMAKIVSASHVGVPAMFPGQELFQRAMELLPDPASLFEDCITAMECLCAIALYLQSADLRNTAYVYVCNLRSVDEL